MAAATIPARTSGSSVLQQQLISESGRIGPSLWKYSVGTSAWPRIISRGVWPDGMGQSYSTVNYRRSLAGNSMANAWVSVGLATPSSVATGASPPDISTSRGLPPVRVVEYTTQTQTIQREWVALESPRFNCQSERMTWQMARQLEQIFDILKDAAHIEYVRHCQQEYFRICATANRVFVGAPASGSLNSLYPLPAATATFCKDFATIRASLGTLTETIVGSGEIADGVGPNHSALTGGVLRDIRARLISIGAGDSAVAKSNGAPVFTLVTSAETSHYLHHEPGTRDDLRYGSAGDLLKPLGVEKSLDGFAHVIDPWTPRFTLSDSSADVTVTEVPKYTYTAGDTSSGNGQGYWAINTDYFTAPYEMSFILVKDVMRQLVPAPITTIGKGTKFDPTQALGDFKFLNIPDELLNPDGTMGFFRGVLDNATEPMKTEYGWCIIHRRPDPTYLAAPSVSVVSGLGLSS